MAAKVGLIGLHGLKGSGKDTVATMIYERVLATEGRISCIAHYADTLKLSAAALFGVDKKWFYDHKLKEATIPGVNMTARQIMTDLHDVLIPKFGQDLFVRTVREVYREWRTHWQIRGPYVVADVRYDPRETEWVRQKGGVIVHIYRKSVDLGVAASRHSSERGIQVGPKDFVLYNDGSLEELRTSVDQMVYTLRGYS